MEEIDSKNLAKSQHATSNTSRLRDFAEKIKKTTGWFTALMIKHKTISAVVVLIIVTAVLIFNYLPVVAIGNNKVVNLGSAVKIEKNQIVKLKYTDVSVKIMNFSNTPCPKSQECFGSGATVEYMLNVGDKSYATGSQTKVEGAKYQVETVSTDYETYAEIKIIKSDEN